MSTTKNKTTGNDERWGKKLDTEKAFIKTNSLEDGQSIEGTVLSFKTSKIPTTGKEVTSIIMRMSNGETRTVSPSGNVAYAVKDGLFEIGKTYKIQREGTRKVKGMASGVFGIYPLKVESHTSDNSDI